jgi:hypothetical protein
MGSSHYNTENNAYNFFLSQWRIRIEMAFGRLLTKWQIVCSALEVPLAQCGIVFKACCHLHNFIIGEQVDCQEAIKVVYENGDTAFGYVPSDIDSVPSSGSIL